MFKPLAVAAVFFGLTCSSPQPYRPAPDLSVVRAQIDSLWSKYSAAAVAGDADGIARLYSDSAYVVESGLPTMRGSAALRAVVKEVLGGTKFLESSIRPEITELAGVDGYSHPNQALPVIVR